MEFRFRNGDREWFAYSHLSSFRFNPSVGLLLKFVGDVVSVVLIRGSNLDATVNGSEMNLTVRGFQRHRVLWVREMDQDQLRKVETAGPTIDAIEIAEFESQVEVKEWLMRNGPAFIRKT